MSGIPVMIHLDRNTFRRLETIAKSRRTDMRKLIAAHLSDSTSLTPRRDDPRLADLNLAQQNDIVTLVKRGFTTAELTVHFDVAESTIHTWRRKCREAGLL